MILVHVALVSVSPAVAVLLAALLAPLAARLRRWGLPDALAALVTIVLLLGVPVAAGFVIYARVSRSLDDLRALLALGVDDLRARLVGGPLYLDASQVDQVRDAMVGYLQQAAPTPMGGATTALRVLGAAILSCSPCSSS